MLPLHPRQESRDMQALPRESECPCLDLRRGGLHMIQHPSTRLETRTKESNMCASLRVIETRRHNESKGSSELR